VNPHPCLRPCKTRPLEHWFTMASAGAFARQAVLLLELCDGPMHADAAVQVVEAVVAVFCRGCLPPPRIQQPHPRRSQAGGDDGAASAAPHARPAPVQIEPSARQAASEEQQRASSQAWDKLELYARLVLHQGGGGGQEEASACSPHGPHSASSGVPPEEATFFFWQAFPMLSDVLLSGKWPLVQQRSLRVHAHVPLCLPDSPRPCH
jgi:hypothetical protein